MLEGTLVGGRYAIVKKLGEGGMGSVYEAKHATTGRRVAVKVIAAELAHKPEVAARFEIEARAAGAVDSEHVAQVLDVDHDKELGAPFLVMEFLEGKDLDATLEQYGALPPEVVLRIGKEACLGLEKAHAEGVLHRDIKPANIFLSERDRGQLRVKLLDFGIAKLLGESDKPSAPKLTRTGMIVGSPLYMSPEQARGSKELGVSADVWSLGVVLYQALVGATPIPATEALGELIITLCTTPPTPIRERAPWVPEAVAEIVEKALAMEPSKRWASAKEMGDALAALPMMVPAITKELLRSADRGAAAPAEPAAGGAGAAPVGAERTVPAIPVGALTAVAPTDKTPMPAVTPTERTPPKIEVVAPNTQRMAEPAVAPGATPARPWVGPTKVSGERTEDVSDVEVPAPPARDSTSAAPAKRSSAVPLVIGGVVLAAAGVFGFVKLSGTGDEHAGGTTTSAKPDAAPSAKTSAASTNAAAGSNATAEPVASSAPSTPAAFAGLEGRWKSTSGNLYDAVVSGARLEFRVVDPAQFASQGYAAGEARFAIEPLGGDPKRFILHDHLRPSLTQPKFVGGVSPASCLVIAKEAGGAPLTAERVGERELKLSVASIAPREAQLILVGGALERCVDLATATVTRGKESVITKQ